MRNYHIKLYIFSLLIFFICTKTTLHAQQIIRTIAGVGSTSYFGDGGPAVAAGIGTAFSVAVNDSGDVFICDNYNNVIRKVRKDGIISTYCGIAYPTFGGDEGLATAAGISVPYSLALDPIGNLYIADAANLRVRKVDTGFIIHTVAGIGGSGYFNYDGIPATSAKIGAGGVALDASGNIYVGDANSRVRKINTSGIISTVAGNSSVGYSGNGGAATAASFDGPIGVCVDNAGNIYIADKNNNVVRKVNASGIVSVFAGTGSYGFSGDGGQATAAKFNGPNAVRIDPQGNVIIVDQSNNRIRKVNSAGIISTIAGSTGTVGFAGDGGAPTAAVLGTPGDVCWNRYGNMFISEKSGNSTTTYGRRIREVITIDTLHLTANTGDTVCGYSHVLFTAHELTEHYSCVFTWKLNGANVGINANTYYSDSVNNGDVITCTIIDTASGGFIIAVSDTIHMVVRPVVFPQVLITNSSDTLCAGERAYLTAHPLNGGPAPRYMWELFSHLPVLGTSDTFSYVPHVGDIITCIMISNAVCAHPDTVQGSRAMVVNTSYPPVITLDPHPNDTIAYWGEVITLFTQLTYEGTHPTFQWYRNGAPIAGATNSVLHEGVYANDTLYCVMHSNAPCVFPHEDTSDVMYISIGDLAVKYMTPEYAHFRISPNPNNGSFYIKGLVPNSINGQANITITDLPGKIILSKAIPISNGYIDAPINLSAGIAKGIYLLNIKYGGGSRVLRFVVD